MQYQLEQSRRYDQSLSFSPSAIAKMYEHKQYIERVVQHLEQFQPVVCHFYGGNERPPLDEYHTVAHIARTLVLATLMLEKTRARGIEVDEEVVYWSLIYHDICSNGTDEPDHGTLAADMVSVLLADETQFTPEQTNQIIDNVRYHNKRHEDIPDEIWTKEFLIMTNADALDLVRMEDDRTIIVTIPEAWDLRLAAQALYKVSKLEHVEDEYAFILHCAKELV